MKVSNVEEMRVLDKSAIEKFSISDELLMENAGLATCFVIQKDRYIGQLFFRGLLAPVSFFQTESRKSQSCYPLHHETSGEEFPNGLLQKTVTSQYRYPELPIWNAFRSGKSSVSGFCYRPRHLQCLP